MSVPTDTDRLQLIYSNYTELLVYVTMAIATPTQANIDLAVQATDRLGLMRLLTSHSIGDESYSWTEYRTSLENGLKTIKEQIIAAGGPVWLPLGMVPTRV